MKRFTCLMISIILFCSIAAGCNTTESTKTGLKYGTYKIEKVKHLPLFSSSTPDYFLEQNSGVLFNVKDGAFKAGAFSLYAVFSAYNYSLINIIKKL